jgi:RHS repeat-associated protein
LSNITSFSFDHNGNLLTVMDANQHTTTYTYHNMDRLSTRKDPLQNQESYQYDGNGNVTQFTDRRNKTATFSYDGLNRTTLAGYGTTAGPAHESSVNYTYDSGNRLTQLADTSSGTITRGYDNLDRLTSDAIPQGTVGYDYETACRRTSLTVPGQFVVLADALGSTVGLADVTGILKTNYTHEPFGNTTATGTSTSNSTAYTGRELDATDLYFYRARYYNPTLQRFVSEGPLGFGGGDFNLNVYVGNTPTNYRDPSGEHRFICIPCLPNPGFGGRKSFPSDAYVPPWIPVRRFGPASKGLPGRYPPNSGPRDPESPINPIVEPPTSRVKYRGIK